MSKWISLCLFLLISGCCFAKTLSNVRIKALPGTVALTFDDGPSPVYTPQILKILKEYKVHATFFVMGWSAKKYPKLIKAILADGNVIANHTMSHKMLTKLSPKQLRYEVVQSRDNIEKAAGYAPVCLRPPYGVGNKRVAAYIRKQGMIMVPMGFNSFDYENRGVNRLVQWVTSNAKSGRVFLLHDGYKARGQTVRALSSIIVLIRRQGLGFSTICNP